MTHFRQSSPFLRVELVDAAAVHDELRHAGIECRVREDERSLLWEKLAFLAPVALATTALDVPLGGVREDERYVGCREEALAVADAEGARIDTDAVRTLQDGAPAETRSSMQKDVAAGRQPELDAIAGPIISRRSTARDLDRLHEPRRRSDSRPDANLASPRCPTLHAPACAHSM